MSEVDVTPQMKFWALLLSLWLLLIVGVAVAIQFSGIKVDKTPDPAKMPGKSHAENAQPR